MDAELFSSEIEDRLIALETAADVVRFSFIVQHSISYLDLQLCNNSPISDYFGWVCACCAKTHFRSCLNTEERCRKFFTPSRRLLYTLHLDLPEGRERSLKDAKQFVEYSRYSESRHIAKIGTVCGLRGDILSDLIEEALEVNVPKIKILKMITDMPSLDLPLLCLLPIETAAKFLDLFYPKIPDSKLFKDFIRHFDIGEWTAWTFECIGPLEYLLYCARRHGNVLLEGCEFELATQCLQDGNFESIGPILKYIHAPCLDKEDYGYYLSEVKRRRPIVTTTLVENAEKWMGTERVSRALQIIWMYLESFAEGNSESAAKALGLVWGSIPDPYITYRELEMGFAAGLLAEVRAVHHFYRQAVGEPCENLEPRSLKHLCRTALRRTFWDNELWIPEGIKRLPLPKSLQLYLNLHQPLSIPGTPLSH